MNLEANTSLALMQAAQGQNLNAVSATKDAAKTKELERFEVVSKDFEAMFMTEMLKPMFAEIKPDPRFGGGKGEEIFSGMMLQEYGKMIAETGQIGIADSVKTELIRMQGEEITKQDIHDAKVALREANSNTNPNTNLDMIIEEQVNAN